MIAVLLAWAGHHPLCYRDDDGDGFGVGKAPHQKPRVDGWAPLVEA
jgi:hypothetical protein